jgi:D-alanine-D-alanine ligase
VSAAFPILHGDFGEDGRIQGLLECIGMPFVGCKTVTGAVAADKGFTKAVAESIGIPTVPWTAVNGVPDGERIKEIEDTLSYPIFVKPARLGSSVGAGIAHDRAELCSLLSAAGELGDGRVIAERCLRSPRELECAMLDTARGRIFTFPAEVRTEGEFYSFEEKYSSTSSAKLALRAEITEKTAECIKDYAKALADALGLEGISRIDFFLDGDDIYFNEVNTMPGLTESSLYPGLMEAKEESADFVNLLLESAVGASL